MFPAILFSGWILIASIILTLQSIFVIFLLVVCNPLVLSECPRSSRSGYIGSQMKNSNSLLISSLTLSKSLWKLFYHFYGKISICITQGTVRGMLVCITGVVRKKILYNVNYCGDSYQISPTNVAGY